MIQQQERFPWRAICCGIVLYLMVQGLFVGLPAIGGSSEAREAQVVDVIVRDSTWVLPLRNGIIPSKPPLYHWIAAVLSIGVGEVSEFTARMTSQFSAAVCLLVVTLISFRFAQASRTDQGPRHPQRAALLTAGILSTTYGFYQMAGQAMVDMTFTACVWLALAAVALAVKPKSGSKKPISEYGRTLFWLACCVGILARGPLAVVLPVALVGMAGCCTIGLIATTRLLVLPSLGWVALAIPVGWYYLAYQIGGEAFLERQLYFENVKRFSGGEFVNSESWWFYGPSLLRTTFPWSCILVWLLVSSIFERQTVSYPSQVRRVRWLPSILLFTGLLIFSLSAGKRHSYLLPLLPLVALQLGVELSSLFERGGDRVRARSARLGRVSEVTLSVTIVLVLFAIGVCGEFALNSQGYLKEAYQAVSLLIGRLSVLAVVCTLGAFLGVSRKLPALLGSVWCLMLLIMTGAVHGGLTVKAHLKGFDQLAHAWLATASESEMLAVFKHPFDEYFDPLLYYVHRPVTIITLDAVGMECKANTVYAAKGEWLDAHQSIFNGSVIRVLTARERLAAKKGDTSRDIVFFRCDTYATKQNRNPQNGAPQNRFESIYMQNAAYPGGGVSELHEKVGWRDHGVF